MNRLRAFVLALTPAAAVSPAGCTADFFVGPLEGSSSTTVGPDDSDPSSTTLPPLSTTGDGSNTTQTPTTGDPDLTTSSTTDVSSTTEAEATEGTTQSTEGTTGATTEDTEEPADCIPKGAPACEEAFPTCLWNGKDCTVNLCNVGDEKACLTEAPECIWEGGGCIPSECGEEAECSVLEPAACEKAKGCVLVAELCFTPTCVPCTEVESIVVCNELPNCDYNEGREACLPL